MGKQLIGRRRREAISRFLLDLDKAIFAVGLASYFFERFPQWMRIALMCLFWVFMIVGILLQPEGKDDL